MKTSERKIIRTELLEKEKAILHSSNCWVTSRALFGAHSSPRQQLMNAQAAPPACSSASCKDAHLETGHNLLLDRRSSIFINQKSPHFVLLLPAVQITHPQVLSILSLTVQERWASNAATLPALSWGICPAKPKAGNLQLRFEQFTQKILETQKV